MCVSFLLESISQAWKLVSTGDPDFLSAVSVSLRVSAAAVLVASAVALPAGLALSAFRFPGRGFLLGFFQTLMAVPTVVVGLVSYSLLCRKGPMGALGLLFTPTGMMLAEAILVFPLLVSLCAMAAGQVDPRFGEEAWMLGAGPARRLTALFRQCRPALATAAFAGLGRALSEVGCAMMVGGNIRGYTRNMTTSIAMETAKGEFALGVALGVVLLAMAMVVHLAMKLLERHSHAA